MTVTSLKLYCFYNQEKKKNHFSLKSFKIAKQNKQKLSCNLNRKDTMSIFLSYKHHACLLSLNKTNLTTKLYSLVTASVLLLLLDTSVTFTRSVVAPPTMQNVISSISDDFGDCKVVKKAWKQIFG